MNANANTAPETITTPAPLRLNPSAISQANSASQFNAGDALAREANAVYLEGLKAFAPSDAWTPEQAAYMEARVAAWRNLCEKSYNDVISRRSSWAPWTVTGPAGYNSRRMNARADAQMNAAQEWAEKRARFLENTKKGLADMVPLERQLEAYRRGKDTPIESADPHALEKLSARLEFLYAAQTRCKAINAYYRKHKTLVGCEGIADEKARAMDEKIKSDWRSHPVPFPPYVLQNNGANIRRLEARREQLAKIRAQPGPETNATKTFDTFQVQEDTETMRLKIIFDDKPDDETRAILKANGFRWAPSVKAWQRQLTGNARCALRSVLARLAPEGQQDVPAAPDAQDPETISLDAFTARIGG